MILFLSDQIRGSPSDREFSWDSDFISHHSINATCELISVGRFWFWHQSKEELTLFLQLFLRHYFSWSHAAWIACRSYIYGVWPKLFLFSHQIGVWSKMEWWGSINSPWILLLLYYCFGDEWWVMFWFYFSKFTGISACPFCNCLGLLPEQITERNSY